MQRLQTLLNNSTPHSQLKKWVKGYVPSTYKRINISPNEQLRLALLGQKIIGAYFEDELYFTQALIAGAAFSGDYDSITITTPSQYGKSFLMARIALYLGYKENPVFLTAATMNLTQIIMKHTIKAVQGADTDIKNALGGLKKSQIEKLETSISKKKLAFRGGGYIEPITLGETYSSQQNNNAIGNGGVYIIDEAALCSEDALLETARAELAKDDGTSYPYIQISNPHKPGPFYDDLTSENPPPRTLIVWMDARTAVEEGRYTVDKVLNSKFNRRKDKMTIYWLCELPNAGSSMFELMPTTDALLTNGLSEYTQYYAGIDAAYKGKDDINIIIVGVDEDGYTTVVYSDRINVTEWIDGVTSKQICDALAHILNKYHVAQTCIDQGYGVWLIEELASRNINVKGVNFASKPTKFRQTRKDYAACNAQNLRAEMHLDLQDLIENKYISAPQDIADRLNNILPFITSEIKTSGKYQIMPKSELKAMIGHSPDELDSLLLAIHAAILSGTIDDEFITEN